MHRKNVFGPKPVTLNQADQEMFKDAMAALDAAIDPENLRCCVDKRAKEAMRLYLGSWVRHPLMRINNKIYLAEQEAKDRTKKARAVEP